MSITRITLRAALRLAALLAVAGPAPAQFTATKVVETGVSYPGVGTFFTFEFNRFGSAPSLSGGTVAFTAAASTAGGGIFTATPGAVTPVATAATPIPGGIGNFTTIVGNPVGLSGSGVAFEGRGSPGPGNTGIFSTVTGPLAPVVTNVTPYPLGGQFTTVSSPAVSGQTVVFWGTNSPLSPVPLGVFTKTGSGPITVVASTATPIPGGTGNFLSFNFPDPIGVLSPFYPSISGSNVVFGGQGSGGQLGIFASIGGSLAAVATTSTPIPGTGGFFSGGFGHAPVIDGTTVAFVGYGPTPGVYAWTPGGGLARVADTTTAAPGGTGTFNDFNLLSVSIGGGRVAFGATTTTGQAGIYTGVPGSLQKVVGVGDVIDGKTVREVGTSRFASSGPDTAVYLRFTDESSAVYVFSPVPEPAGLLAVGVAGLAAARAWRRRRAARR
jgi:hypothetical protein